MSYCTLADVRAEGVTSLEYNDARVTARIAEARRIIDRATGWWFDARTYDADSAWGPLALSGTDTTILHLPAPIVSVAAVRYVYRGSTPVVIETLAATGYLAFDGPEDMQNPKLQRLCGTWRKGVRNIEVDCVLGYLERDPTTGVAATPLAIKRACIALTIALLPDLGDPDAAEQSRLGALTSFTTVDRSETYSAISRARGPTGLPDVDRTLMQYSKRIRMGLV